MDYKYKSAAKLYHSDTSETAFLISAFERENYFDTIQKLNCYSIIWIKNGNGKLRADFSEFEFEENTIMFFAPYQPFVIYPFKDITGVVIHFHTDFFCLEKHREEISCNGVLFNNIYTPPFIHVNEENIFTLNNIIESINKEIDGKGIAQHELIRSYLKIFLINTSRIKIDQTSEVFIDTLNDKESDMRQRFKECIERHFRIKHSPADYADLLNITPKLLGKLTKSCFNKTPLELIQERIIIEAKRELYLTRKRVKEIAFELGFKDVYYFSRLFKNCTEISPKLYREKITSYNEGNYN
jgi:AraC family transcriptional activator of pobA